MSWRERALRFDIIKDDTTDADLRHCGLELATEGIGCGRPGGAPTQGPARLARHKHVYF